MATINARYMSYGIFREQMKAVSKTENFKASDVAIGAGYAYQFEEDWTIGGGLNFITSKIDNYTSSAISGTAGITYHNKKNKETALLFSEILDISSNLSTEQGKPSIQCRFGYTRILKEFLWRLPLRHMIYRNLIFLPSIM
jgi:long-subunit fatty acid transport protein